MADPGFDDQQLGTEGFRWAIAQLPAAKRAAATRLVDWAVVVEKERIARLEWVRRRRLGVLQKLALPLDNPRDRNCLTIFTCDMESVYLQLWRSLFQKHAPESIERVEAILAAPIGQGTWYHEIPEELLDALADAYREAAVPWGYTSQRGTYPSGRQEMHRYSRCASAPAVRLLGGAVPVPLAEALGGSLVDVLSDRDEEAAYVR